jgi:uncharacterized protein YeeX (DUF496 family)
MYNMFKNRYKIVLLANLDEYLHNGNSETEMNIKTRVNNYSYKGVGSI